MGAADIPSGFSGFASSAWVCPLGPVSFRPARRRFVPCGGTLFRAYRAQACGPARAPVGAGAVRAPDCARARGKRRAHVSRLFRQGFFSHRRETGGKAAPRMPLPPASFYHKYFRVKPYLGIISKKLRNVRPPSILRAPDGREPRPPPTASGTGNGRRLHRSGGCGPVRNAVRSDRMRLRRDPIRSNRPPSGEKPSDGQNGGHDL